MFLNINEIDGFELQIGEQVLCTHSRVKGRTGVMFTVVKFDSKERMENAEVSRRYLSFLCSYGDQFDKV